ncbi:uncharacterized protein LOC135205698 isoform X2 [Macrobrachium nipponense]|uniref:uncharacterized protein LOC135205698 isoform X2 n=1 Tax=Macrobrachium nipponense TaxID=159736 RepID=UPI0030C80D0D
MTTSSFTIRMSKSNQNGSIEEDNQEDQRLPHTEEVSTEDPAEVRWRSRRRRASSVSAVSPDPSHPSGDAVKDANSRAYWRRVRSLSRENRQRQEARDRQLKRSELEERRRREHILAERKREKDALMRRFLREPLEQCRIRAAKENSKKKNDDMNDEEIAIETESLVRPSQSAPDLDEALRIVRGEDKALDARAHAFLSPNRRRRYCSEEKSQLLKEEKICDRFLRTHNPRIPPHQPPIVPFAGQTKRRVPGPPTRPFPPGSSDDIIRENQKPYPTLPPEELISKTRPKRSSSIGENSLKMGTTKVLNDTFGDISGIGEIDSILADYKPPLESHIMVLPKPKLERRSSMPDLRDFRFVSSAVVYETIAALSNLGDARGLMVLPSHDLANSVDLNNTSAPEIVSSKSQSNEFFHKNSQKWVKKMTKYIKEETQAVLSHSPLIGSLSPTINQIGLQKGRKAQRKEWIAKHSSLKNLQKTILPTFSETASQTENMRPMSAVLHRRNSLGSEGADSVYYDSLEEDESRASKQSSTTQAFYVPMKNDIPANKVLVPTLPARLTARLEKRRTVPNKRPFPNTVPQDDLLLIGKHVEVLSDEALLTHLTATEVGHFSDAISNENANVSSDSDILDSPKVKETICNGNISPQISDQSAELSQSDIIQITSTDMTQKGSLNSLPNITDTISNSFENRSEMSFEKSDPLPEPSSAQYSDTYTQITDQSSYAPDKEASKSNATEENCPYNENSVSEIDNEDSIRNKRVGFPAMANEISPITSDDNEDKDEGTNELDAGAETQAEETQENRYENRPIDNQNETYDNATLLQHSVEEEIPKSESSEENYNTDSFQSVSYSYEKSEEDISEVLDNAESDIQNNESNSEVEVQTATPEPASNNTSGSSAVHDDVSESVISGNNNPTKDSPRDMSDEISEETSSNPSQDQLEIIGFTSHGKETLLESGFIDCDDASLTPDPLNNNGDKSGLFSTNEPGSETEIDNNKAISMNADKTMLEVDQKMVAECENETFIEESCEVRDKDDNYESISNNLMINNAMGQHVQSDANNPEILSQDSKQLTSMEDMITESLQDGDFGMSLNDGFFLNDDESASPISINEVDQEEFSDGNDSSDRITVIRVPSGESNYDSGEGTPDIDAEFPLPIEEDTNEYISDSVSPSNTVPDNDCETDLLHEIFSSNTSNEGKQTPVDEISSGLSTIEEDDELIEALPIREQGQEDVLAIEETEVTEEIGEEPLKNDDNILTEDTQDVRNDCVDRNSICSIDDLDNFDKNVSTDINEDELVMDSESGINIEKESTVANKSESEKENLDIVEQENTADIVENEGNLDGDDGPEILKENQDITIGANNSKNECLQEHYDPLEEKREIESEDAVTEDFGNTENNQQEISGEILIETDNVTMEDIHLAQESHTDKGNFEVDLKEPNNDDQTGTYERNSREVVEKEGKEPIEEILESKNHQECQFQNTFNEKEDVEEMDKTLEESSDPSDGKIGNAVSECHEKEVMGDDEITGLVAETDYTNENGAGGDIQESKGDNEEDDEADTAEENETGEVNEHKEVFSNKNDEGMIEGKLDLSDEYETESIKNLALIKTEGNKSDILIENEDQYDLKVDIMDEVIAASVESEDNETDKVTENADQNELEVDAMEEVVAMSRRSEDWEIDKVIVNVDESHLEVNLEEAVAVSEEGEDTETEKVTETEDPNELEEDLMENEDAISGEFEDNKTDKVINNDDEYQLEVDMEEMVAASEGGDIETINVTENRDQNELEEDILENAVAISGECEDNETDKVTVIDDEYHLEVDMEEMVAASEGGDIETINVTENKDQNELEVDTLENKVAISEECEENETDNVMENDDEYQLKVNLEEVVATSDEGGDIETKIVEENEDQNELEEDILENAVAISEECEDNETDKVTAIDDEYHLQVDMEEVTGAPGGEDIETINVKEDETQNELDVDTIDNVVAISGECEENETDKIMENDNEYQMMVDMEEMAAVSEEGEDNETDEVIENEEQYEPEESLIEEAVTISEELEVMATDDAPEEANETQREEEQESNLLNEMATDEVYLNDQELERNEEEMTKDANNGVHDIMETLEGPVDEGIYTELKEEDNASIDNSMEGISEENVETVKENIMSDNMEKTNVCMKSDNEETERKRGQLVDDMDTRRHEDNEDNPASGTENMIEDESIIEEELNSIDVSENNLMENEDIYSEEIGTLVFGEMEVGLMKNSEENSPNVENFKNEEFGENKEVHEGMMESISEKEPLVIEMSDLNGDICDNGGTYVSDNETNGRPAVSESEASDLSLFSDETQDITEPIIRPEYEESLEFTEGLIENEVFIGNKTIRHFNSSQMMAIPHNLVIAGIEDAPMLLCQEFDDSFQNKVLTGKDTLKRAEDSTSSSHIQNSNQPLDEVHLPESLMEGEVAFSDDESPREGSNPEGAAANSPSSDSGVVEMAGKTTNSPLECSRDNGDLRIQNDHDSHVQDSVNNEIALEVMQGKRLSTKQAKDRANRITSGRRRPISASGKDTEVKEPVMMRSWTSLQGQEVALNNNTEGNNKGTQSQDDVHNPSSQIESDATSRSKYQLVQDYLDNLPHHPPCKNESPLCTAGSLPGSVNEMQTDNNSDFGSSETGEGSYSERLLKALEARRLRRHRPPSSNIDHEEGPKKYRPSSLSALDAFLATLSRYRGGSECGDDNRDDSLTPSLTGDDVTVQVRAGPRHHDVRVSSRRQVRLVVNVSNPGATSDSGCVPDTSRTERLRRKEAPTSGKSPLRQWNQHHKGREDRPSTANRDKTVDAEVDQLLSDVREYLNKKLNRVGRENPTAEAPSAEIFVEGSNIEKCFKERPSVGSRTRLYPKHRPKQEEQQWRRPTQPTNPILREQQKIQNSISAINSLLKQFS